MQHNRGIAASRHRGIAASRHRGIAASRHRGIAASQAAWRTLARTVARWGFGVGINRLNQ